MEKLNQDIEKSIKEFKGQEYKGKDYKGYEWTEQELATKAGIPLVDSATGKKIIIRLFDYEWPKGIKKEEIQKYKNDKQVFFNGHAKYIRDFLWKDGLSIREDHDPKMIFNKKGYRIAVLCEARFGVSIFDRPTDLQTIMKPFAKLKK